MRRFIALIAQTASEWSKDKAPRLAAALAYYTAFSLAPLLIIVIQLAALVIGGGHAGGHHEVLRKAIFSSLSGVIGHKASDALRGIVDTIVHQQRQGIIAAAVSWGLLLFGALGLVDALQDALNTIWHVPPAATPSIWSQIRKRLTSFAMIGGIAFILIVSLLVNTALSAFAHVLAQLFPGLAFLMKIADFIGSFGIIALLFALMYKYLPDTNIQWGDVWTGAALTAALFDVGQFLLGWYLGRASTASAYGAAGSLVLILLWVFYSAQIFLFGAEFTKVSGGRPPPSPSSL